MIEVDQVEKGLALLVFPDGQKITVDFPFRLWDNS